MPIGISDHAISRTNHYAHLPPTLVSQKQTDFFLSTEKLQFLFKYPRFTVL